MTTTKANNRKVTITLGRLVAVALVAVGLPASAAPGEDADQVTPVRATVFRVNDYGAVADSGANAKEAIDRAIAAAKAHGGPGEVVFGEGTYRVETPFAHKDGFFLPHCIVIDRGADLLIRGTHGKTRLLVTNPKNGLFWVKNSQRVTFDDLTVDYDPLPFTQGRIAAVDTKALTVDVRLDDGYAELDRSYFSEHVSMLTVFDPKVCPDLPPGAEVITPSARQRVGQRVWRITSAGPWIKRFDPKAEGPEPLKSPYVRPGVKVVLSARNGGDVVMFAACTDSVVRRVTAYACPGGFLAMIDSRNLRVSDCKDCTPDGSNRLLSTCADGIHLKNLRGALTIERCRLEKMGDDSINFHAMGSYVEKVVSADELLLNGRGWSGLLARGDRLQIIDQRSGLRAEATVASLQSLDGGRRFQVRLDRPVVGVKAGSDRTADLVFSATSCPDPFTVRDNYLASQTEILARGLHGLIENNTLVSTTSKPAIVMTYSGFPWFEGPIPQEIRIRNNTFIGKRGVQILLDGGSGDGIRDITITGNHFCDIASPMLVARGVRNILCRDNTIDNGAAVPRGAGYSCMIVDAASGVTIDRLRVKDASAKLLAVLTIGRHVAAGKNGVKLGEIDAKINPSAKVVLDRRGKN